MANEKRLIDANVLLEELAKFENPMPNKSGYDFLCGIATAITEIENAPTVDAVEAVRCGECGYSPDGWVCFGDGDMMPQHPTYPERYCSCGKRRADG